MNAAGPLAGRRLLVTRAREQNRELVDKLKALGAEVIMLPMIEIAPPDSYAPLDAALQRLGEYQWLLLTSVNGVHALQRRLPVLGLDVASFTALQVAAVGRATATALQEMGIAVAVTPEQYVAESLVEALRERTRGKRVLLLRARVARDVIPEELRKAGALVDVADAYQTVMPAGSSAQLSSAMRAGPPDAVLFASSSAVKHFLDALHQAGYARLPGMQAVSIGPVTSASLRDAGWEPAAEASISTADGLVEASVQLFRDQKWTAP